MQTTKLDVSHNRFEEALNFVTRITPSETWLPVEDIENSEEMIAANPMSFFDYIVWLLFTTPPPEDDDEQDARDTLEYLFDKYFTILE